MKNLKIKWKDTFLKNCIKRNQIKYGRTLLLVGMVILLSACGGNSTGSQPEEEEQITGAADGLFLSLSDDENGLYLLDSSTGEAVRVGEGKTAMKNAPGLAAKGSNEPLIGASEFSLYEVKRDGSGAALIGDPSGQALTEGLAFNPDGDILYASSNGFLHIRSPLTGETIETVLTPPNQPDIEALAYDPQTKILFGIARGFEQQPEFRRGLFLLDTTRPKDEWAWAERGDTGGLWADAGLAYVPEIGMLFAVGRMGDDEGVYSINPETGDARRIGSTGLGATSGGLAWVPAN